MRKGLGIAQAFRTITVIPVPGQDAEKASAQLHFYPLVGLSIGSLGAFILYLVMKMIPDSPVFPMVLGVLWTCYMAFITRGFHLDGLGDMADGFGGGWTRQRRLEIMKDSRSGSFAVIAISLCLLLKSASAAAAIQSDRLLSLVWAVFLARVQVVFMCAFCSYAKEEGLSYSLVSGAGFRHVVSAMVQTGLVGFGFFSIFHFSLYLLIIPAIVSTLAMGVVAILSKHRIGGVTGDILGACCEICEVFATTCIIFLN